MFKHIVSVAGFILVTFTIQGLSHFIINKDHYASIGFLRLEPIMPLGFLTMIIQGLVLSLAFAAWRGTQVTIRDGVALSAAFGIFLVSYIMFATPAKYLVPSISSWMMIEGLAGFAQFALFGLVLAVIHKRFT